MRIGIVDLQGSRVDKDLIRRVVRRVARGAPRPYASVTIALVDDARITELNRAHRGKNRPTDVLAYDADPDDPEYMGDVVISVETAVRQAEGAKRPPDHEVAWLAAHGILHLLGSDDADEKQRQAMIAQQDEALAEALARQSRCARAKA